MVLGEGQRLPSEAPLYSRHPCVALSLSLSSSLALSFLLSLPLCAARVRSQESLADLRTQVLPRLGQHHGHQQRLANKLSNAQRFAPAWVNTVTSAMLLYL